MSRPVIGVTASVEVMRTGGWEEETVGNPLAYVASVQRAGARAVGLPPDPVDPPESLTGLDGLLVTGSSGDTDPARYGGQPHERTEPVVPVRDEFEFALVAAALEAGLPLLGVCRGMQVLNVSRGGTLEQHLPDVLGHDRHAGPPGTYADHEVRLESGSLAARAVGAERTAVKSYHHQGVGEVGEGLVATGWSGDDDEVIEAIERPGEGFVLGVLWHPEEDERSEVVAALVAAATT